ncbi:protein TBATA [Tachysurus ichikawai]
MLAPCYCMLDFMVMELTEGRDRDEQEGLKTRTLPPFLSDLKNGSLRVSTSSSARFGALSHHSFFSRHNPHPHRVRHISGELQDTLTHLKSTLTCLLQNTGSQGATEKGQRVVLTGQFV